MYLLKLCFLRQIVVETMMILSTMLGFYQYVNIDYEFKKDAEHLDAILLIICLVGPLVYEMFSLFGISLIDEEPNSAWSLSLTLPLIDIFQCVSQVSRKE